MSPREARRPAVKESKALEHDPLSEADEILSHDFYGRGQRREQEGGDRRRRRRSAKAKPKPTHYKVICISLYTRDIELLEAKVAELKQRGYTKANKSQLIRMALGQLDLDKIRLPEI
jgi:hypothetical protein